MFEFLILRVFVFFCFLYFICGNHKFHNKPFGSGDWPIVLEHKDFINPIKFVNNHLKLNKPLLFKRSAAKWHAFEKWNDEYFLNLNLSDFNKTTVHVELNKKENRSFGTSNIEFKEFINIYNHSNIYLVDKLPKFLDGDILVPWSLQCSFLQDSINQVLMWFSSGGTKSVIHTDDMENINCLISGEKTFVLVDPHLHKGKIPLRDIGAYSDIDVDKVDFNKYPNMGTVEYQIANMSAGDCLYIPKLWIHQVRSFNRNIAINIWFTKTQSELEALSPSDLENQCSSISLNKTFFGTNFVGLDEAQPSLVDMMSKLGNLGINGLFKTLMQEYPELSHESLRKSLIHVESVINDIFLELDESTNNISEIEKIKKLTKEKYNRVANYLQYLKVFLESLMIFQHDDKHSDISFDIVNNKRSEL